MSRARCYAAYADAAGNKLTGTSVYVYNPGTTTPISETIYDSFAAGGALANPLTTDANGGVLFYLAAPKRVDLQFQKAGYADFTLRDVQVTPDAADILLPGSALDGAKLTAGTVPAAALAADVRPCVYALSNAVLSVANGVETGVPLQTEIYDTDNMHDNAVNNNRITFNTAGIYEVTVWLVWNTNVTGYRVMYVRSGEGATLVQNPAVMPVTGAETTQEHTFPVVVGAAGEFIQASGVQTSGGALNLNAARIFAKRIG